MGALQGLGEVKGPHETGISLFLGPLQCLIEVLAFDRAGLGKGP